MNQKEFTYDASARLRVADAHNLSDLKILYADNPYIWENVGTGTASFNINENAVDIEVTAGQYEIRRSKQYFQYYAGNCQSVEMTFDNFQTQSGVVKRVGYFSSNAVAPYDSNKDGFWLEDDGTTKYLVVSKNGVETLRKPITDWNESYRFQNYNWQNFTVVQFDYLWLGGAVLRMFVKIEDAFELAYQFDYPGTAHGVFTLFPNQNVRSEIRSTGGAGKFDFHCCRVATEGQVDNAGICLSANTGHLGIACANIGTTYPLLGIRKLASRRYEVVELDSIEAFVGSTNDQALITLQINPTLSAPLTYAQWDATSVETAKGNGTITVTTPGKIQYSKYVRSDVDFPSRNLELDFLNNIGMSIQDISDSYVICVTPITSSVTMYASANMRQF